MIWIWRISRRKHVRMGRGTSLRRRRRECIYEKLKKQKQEKI